VFDAYLLPPEEARKEEAATVPAPAAGGEE